MTDGHKHRIVHIKSFDAWWVKALRLRLIHRMICTDAAWHRVERSPYPYQACPPEEGLNARCWTLTPFAILHRWTGLTLCNSGRPCPTHDPLPHACGDPTCTEAHP